MAREPIKVEHDVPKATLASAIINISDALTALRKSGLNRKAIVVLIADKTKASRTLIVDVLDALETLKKDYCS